MQQTTNYSLLIPEGTDVVNPLTQVNPNFQTIDGAMFANKQSSIGTATEVLTGTVHAIVRNNTDSDIFRFTATGAWTAGDSMTLDGTSVTVHLSDGTAPATGAYIIGAEVVAVVNGTLVTLLTSAAQPVAGVTSFNSRTGAVVPQASDYSAADIDYDNTLSGLAATDVQAAIDEIATSGGSGRTKVYDASIVSTPGTWENFSGITSASLIDYDYIDVTFFWTIGGVEINTTVRTKISDDIFTQQFFTPQVVDGGVTYRILIELKFEGGQLKYRINVLGYTITMTKAEIFAFV